MKIFYVIFMLFLLLILSCNKDTSTISPLTSESNSPLAALRVLDIEFQDYESTISDNSVSPGFDNYDNCTDLQDWYDPNHTHTFSGWPGTITRTICKNDEPCKDMGNIIDRLVGSWQSGAGSGCPGNTYRYTSWVWNLDKVDDPTTECSCRLVGQNPQGKYIYRCKVVFCTTDCIYPF